MSLPSLRGSTVFLGIYRALKRWSGAQSYLPSPLLGLILNPLYIQRRGLYLAIAEYAPRLVGRIMDFGAGSSPYRKLFAGAHDYVTVDVEVSGHPEWDKKAEIYYDGHVLPFEDRSFDGIFAAEVFEHVFNLDEILCELHRVLRPGGLLLCSTPFVWDEHDQPWDFARYTSYGLQAIFERHGFELVAQRKTTTYLATAFAQISAYFLELSYGGPWIVRLLARFVIALPLNALGTSLGKVLPKNDRLFCNIVCLCRRPAD